MDKKYSAKEAAIAVLKKAEEMLKKHEHVAKDKLDKVEHNPNIKGVHNATGGASSAGIAVRGAKRAFDHAKSGKASSPKIEKEMGKDHLKNAKSYHKKVLTEMKEMPKPKLDKADKMEKKYEGFKAVEESAAKSGAANPAAVAAKVGMEKYGKKRFEEHAHEGKSFKKGEKVENNITPSDDVQKDPNPLTNAHEQKEVKGSWGDVKGHIKLAKFCGWMEAKRGKKAE